MRRTSWLALALLATFTLTSVVQADTRSRKLYDETLRATVLVCVSKDGKITPMGTGWVLDLKEKLIVTNYHVVPNFNRAYVTFPLFKDGKLVTDPKRYRHDLAIPAKVIDSDPKCDLAVLQLGLLPEGVRELKLAKEKPSPADTLHLVGNPGASDGYWVYTTGTVRQLVHKSIRYDSRQVLDANVIESQMSTNYGDSGSAVVNDAGEVVGVHSGAHHSSAIRAISWHIGLDEVKSFLGDVRSLLDEKATAAVYERRGQRQMRKDNLDEAIEDYTSAIRLDRKRSSAYRYRSRAFYLKKDYDATINDATKALELDPNDSVAINERGNAYLSKREYARAITDYTKAVGLMPDDAVIRLNRGMSYDSLGKTREALDDFSEAIRLSPKYTRAYVERASVYRSMKKYDDAIADYRTALSLSPENPTTLASLGHCYQDALRHSDALQAYLDAIKAKHPDPSLMFRCVGHASFDLKKYDQAVEAYTYSLKINPKDANSWFWRGASLEAQGQVTKANQNYDEAIKLDSLLAKKLSNFTTKNVVVRNKTGEPLEVHVNYEVYTDKGNWRWYSAVWNIAAGKEVQLLHDNWQVHARKMRIWASSKTSKDMWTTHKDQDVVIVDGEYRARKRAEFVYNFNP